MVRECGDDAIARYCTYYQMVSVLDERDVHLLCYVRMNIFYVTGG